MTDNAHRHHAVAQDPTWSLLRLSAAYRVAAAGGLAALLWAAILFWAMGG